MGNQRGDGRAVPKRRLCNWEWTRTLGRCTRYMAVRLITVALTVLVGVYAAIWVTNLGGYSDERRTLEATNNVRFMIAQQGAYLNTLTPEAREAYTQSHIDAALRAADLDQPFVVRSLRYFKDAFTLNLGMSYLVNSRLGHGVAESALSILMDRLPMTVLLFGSANLITFFLGLLIALALSRRYGTLLDRLTTLLIPILSAPSWFHGVILIVVFASVLRILPFGNIVGTPPPQTALAYLASMLKHMILPVSAIVLGTLPQAVYANRALFLIHASEDFVELAHAKGLSGRRLQWRYILRPVLPPIITNFVFIAIVSWQGVILVEQIFNWPGMGRLLIAAIQAQDVVVVVGAVTLFAYLLGLSVLFLDLLYVIVDPRVKLGTGGRA